MTEKLFAEYTGIKVKQFRETLLLHMGNVKKSVAERTRHKRQYDRRMKERQMQLRDFSGTYITHVVDADIRPVNDQEPSAEVHLTAQHNVLANKKRHTDLFRPSYNTYLLEKVDSNTTLDSTNMCHRGGEIEQDAEQDQVKSLLIKAEFLKMNDMVEKEVIMDFQTDFYNLKTIVFHLKFQCNKRKKVFKETNHKCVFNANHDDCTTKFLKEVNSQGYRFSPNKSSTVHEKPNTPRSYLRWKPIDRIFKTVGLRYIFQSSKGKTQSLVTKRTDISETIGSRNLYMMYMFNDVYSHQFRPRSSTTMRLLETLQDPLLKERKAAIQEPVVLTGTPLSTRLIKIHLLQVPHKPLKKHNLMLFLLVLKKMIMVGMQSISLKMLKKLADETEELWAVTALADVPSSFTATNKTTSTLPPPPPPLKQSTVHRDICAHVEGELFCYEKPIENYKDGKVRYSFPGSCQSWRDLPRDNPLVSVEVLRAKITTIEESKYFSSLAVYELIGNLKVHEVVMEKDFKIYRGKKERIKSIALKDKKESSDDETSTSGSDDEEYDMT
nr:actin-binding, cofilin/tropomyosin type [Tanacetum cinerariifolium]